MNSEIAVIIASFLAGVLVSGMVFYIIDKSKKNSVEGVQKQLEAIFGNLSRQALSENQSQFFQVAREQFEGLLQKSELHIKERSQVIDTSLQAMNQKLEGLSSKTNELSGKLEESNLGIGRLSDTTSQLRQILSSSQQRGRWGERMVEDILNFIGLKEGLNYEKQASENTGRPDFTFKLPREKYVNMDVKFPLAHYEKYLLSQNDNEKESEKNQFLKDVRDHIKSIEKRDYVNTAEGSLDYVMMFIPNESIYYFINQEDAEIIDFALSRKIILCSPITLYAVLSLIRQAVSNFAMEEKAGLIQKYVGEFREQWTRFIEKMDGMGKSLDAARKNFDDLSSTRARALDRRMEKIAELQTGQIEEGSAE
jgi:DNA recombination protein RmuC